MFWRVVRLLLAILVLLLLAAAPAFGDDVSLYSSELRDVIQRITHLAQVIAVSIASLFVVIAGIRWMMAGGDMGEIDKAKRALMGAAIGYLVALAGRVILAALDYVLDFESD